MQPYIFSILYLFIFIHAFLFRPFQQEIDKDVLKRLPMLDDDLSRKIRKSMTRNIFCVIF